MRAGGATGHADLADLLTFVHHRFPPNRQLRKMHVERKDAETMIDHHSVAGEEEIPREHDATAVRSVNRRTLPCAEIDSGVRAAGLAVEKTAKPERRSGSPLAR